MKSVLLVCTGIFIIFIANTLKVAGDIQSNWGFYEITNSVQ